MTLHSALGPVRRLALWHPVGVQPAVAAAKWCSRWPVVQKATEQAPSSSLLPPRIMTFPPGC